MKIASAGLKNLLATQRNLIFADLWKFTLKNGTVLRYTTWDKDLVIDSETYKSHDVIITNGGLKQTRGADVNQTEVDLYPNLTSSPSVVEVSSNVAAVYGGLMSLAGTEGGAPAYIPFLQACVFGLLDRAKAERFRIFMPTPGDVSLAPVRIFLGEINSFSATRNMVKATCKDATDILNIQMPRRQYQPKCAWTFGDSDCGVNKSALQENGTVASGSASTIINCALTDAAGTYNYGSVKMTSGQNNGVYRAVKSYQPGMITLTGGFPFPLNVGDTFIITPGCSKNFSGATQSFNGAANIGSTQTVILAALTNVAGYFNGGQMQFTSGANIGQSRIVSIYTPGEIIVSVAWLNTPVAGDEFIITSSPDNTVTTCTGYNNTINFGGQPYVPIPETAY